MKKIVLILLLTLCSSVNADAQSLFDMLKGFFGDSTKSDEQVDNTPKFITRAELLGEWTFSSGEVSYSGDDPIARMAISALKGEINPYLNRANVIAGRDKITFRNNNKVIASIADKSFEGEYNYNESTGVLTISLAIENIRGSLEATTKLENGTLTILFKAKEALDALKRASSEFAENEHIKIAEQIINSYPEVELGGSFKK